MVIKQCPWASIANMPVSGSGSCWCQKGYDMTRDAESSWKTCLLSSIAKCEGEPTPGFEGALCEEWSANEFDNNCHKSSEIFGVSAIWMMKCNPGRGKMSECHQSLSEYGGEMSIAHGMLNACTAHRVLLRVQEGRQEPRRPRRLLLLRRPRECHW